MERRYHDHEQRKRKQHKQQVEYLRQELSYTKRLLSDFIEDEDNEPSPPSDFDPSDNAAEQSLAHSEQHNTGEADSMQDDCGQRGLDDEANSMHEDCGPRGLDDSMHEECGRKGLD